MKVIRCIDNTICVTIPEFGITTYCLDGEDCKVAALEAIESINHYIGIDKGNKPFKRLAEASEKRLKQMEEDIRSGRFDEIINSL